MKSEMLLVPVSLKEKKVVSNVPSTGMVQNLIVHKNLLMEQVNILLVSQIH